MFRIGFIGAIGDRARQAVGPGGLVDRWPISTRPDLVDEELDDSALVTPAGLIATLLESVVGDPRVLRGEAFRDVLRSIPPQLAAQEPMGHRHAIGR